MSDTLTLVLSTERLNLLDEINKLKAALGTTVPVKSSDYDTVQRILEGRQKRLREVEALLDSHPPADQSKVA